MPVNRSLAAAAATLVAGGSLLLAAAPASAHEDAAPASRGNMYTADIDALNGSGASGTADVKVRGTRVDVSYQVAGLLPDAPHAAHIHYGEQARNECPTLAMDDADGDGRLATLEGVPAYGPIVVSLTTSGDTSPASGLAIDRFSTAPGGTIDYDRSGILTSKDTARDIRDGEAVLVVHGVDYNDNGVYDFEAGASDLTSDLPREATDPAACGVIN